VSWATVCSKGADLRNHSKYREIYPPMAYI